MFSELGSSYDRAVEALNKLKGIHELVNRMISDLFDVKTGYRPDMDMYLCGEYLLLIFNLAGVDPKQLELSVRPYSVKLAGRRRLKVPERLGIGELRLEDALYSTNYWGAFDIEVKLPEKIVPAETEAVFEAGLLFVKLKRELHRVKIKG